MFMLCTFADQMYWTSCIEPLLYPKGCSFYRPFSYREDYISPSLISVFRDTNQLERLLPLESWNKGILCIRFRDDKHPEYRGSFIPLRLVTLTSVNVTDTIQVNFRLGDYVKLTPEMRLKSLSLKGIIDYEKDEYMLLIDMPPDKTELLTSLGYQTDFPARLWERLADDDAISPIARENFAGTVVLRLIQVFERGETGTLSPKQLSKEGKNYGTYGYELRSEKLYDFDFAYSRIIAAKKSMQQVPFDYSFNSSSTQFDISRDRIVITGNYRRELVWVQPKIGRPAPTFIEWIGSKKTERGMAADPSIDKILDFRLPVKLVKRFWSKERIIEAVLGGVSLICSVASFLLAIKMTQFSSILIPIGAFLAGLFGSTLKDFLRK